MDSNRYIQNAKRVIALTEKGIGSARIDKPCKKCRFHKFSFLHLHNVCKNPVVMLAASQASNEYGMERLLDPSHQRSKNSSYGEIVCGPDAVLFEER